MVIKTTNMGFHFFLRSDRRISVTESRELIIV